MNAAVELDAPISDLLRRVRSGYLPPPELTVSEFSDEHIIVTSGPLAGTHWQTSFAPYQRGILDAFHEPGVQIVAVMGSSQWGKTACVVNIVAYHIAHDPCPILVVEPTVKPMAEDFSKNRLEPVIKATPILSDTVSKKRAKDASNTTFAKTFRGGSIAITGANSASSLAARPTRLLACDEIDRYPAELPGEGNTLSIAFKRTTAYRQRRRIILTSSPTLEDGPIHTWFKRGDQRRYFVPCPSCDTMHPYEWANLRWERNDPSTARLHCPACDYAIDDAERVAILSKGEWRSTRKVAADAGDQSGEAPPPDVEFEDDTIVSFHIWEAYSPMSSLKEIVIGFLRARKAQKSGDASEMHTWQNTTLGEPVIADKGEGVEPHVLLMRKEAYPEGIDLPEDVCCLTMGVDVQDYWLEAYVIGWGIGEESWLIDHHRFDGNTEQPEPWAQLDELIDHKYQHALGVELTVQSTCIDSAGHRTTIVYDYGAKRIGRRVFVIIGRDGQRPIVSAPTIVKWGKEKRQVPLYTIGVDSAKSLVVGRLKLTAPGPGYVHLPHTAWATEEMCEQLTSERLVTRKVKGVPVQEWRKIRARNEALDCFAYAVGALRLIHPNLEQLHARLRNTEPPKPPPKPSPATRWVPQRPGWFSQR